LFGHLHGNSGDIAAWMGEVSNDAGSDWITGRHDNWYGVGGFVRGQARRGTPRHDYVDWKIHQLGREYGKSLGVSLSKAVKKEMAFSLDIAEVPQSMPQSFERRPSLIRENTDFPKTIRLLRSRGGRPRKNRAAPKFDKLAPSELTELHLTPRRDGLLAKHIRLLADQKQWGAAKLPHVSVDQLRGVFASFYNPRPLRGPARVRGVDNGCAEHPRGESASPQ